jgi:hypothetical protein
MFIERIFICSFLKLWGSSVVRMAVAGTGGEPFDRIFSLGDGSPENAGRAGRAHGACRDLEGIFGQD